MATSGGGRGGHVTKCHLIEDFQKRHDIWGHLETCGDIQRHLEAFGDNWSRLET